MISTNSKSFQLAAECREDEGRAALNRLRQQGRLPAIVYGQGMKSESITVDAREMMHHVRHHGRTDVIKLVIQDKKPISVMIKDVQQLNGAWIHMDLMKVDMKKPIKVRVPLEYKGTAPGTKNGGILDVQETGVEVEGLPDDIPAFVDIDVSSLDVGDKLTVKDVTWPSELTILAQEDIILATIVLPRAVTVPEDEPTETVV